MNIITETPKPDGKRVLKVELKPSYLLVAVHPDGYYKLGEPGDEVLPGHMLAGASPVYWCPLEQRWRS